MSGAAPSALRSALDSSIQAYAQDSCLAAKRRAEALHVVFFLNKSIRAQHDELLLCVYSRMIRSDERRALGAFLSLLSRSEPASDS